ncbi:cation-translocating P-type ATPase [Streptomyces sp. TS71-3]|uniref:cation-translocating P-type ATPase n=1 Tax=Streptomyces sp. TS71-3 TaxID=2733862 RepID=UPI001B0FD821|nr:cation-translocating P-type ATPase [Streptomyces sp. TS71-3]GHJ39924.1 magnesium-transporting ATPase [Streptomyces sp. TS71-3]
MAANDPRGKLTPLPTDDAGTRGLTAAQVAERVARGEVNDISVRSSRSAVDIVRANVLTRFNAIIGILWLIMLAVAPVQDTLFGYVIVANTGIGIIQELRAKKTLDGLAVIGEARPTVRRDGRAGRVGTADIVLGDVIEIGPGERIVVDGACLESRGLEIDESLLTGEPDPVAKRPGDELLSGSFVVAGTGAFTATKVGRDAYAARLTEEASRFTLVHSELRGGVSVILKYVTWMMVPSAIALAVSQLVAHHTDLKMSVARAVGGIIPIVPEGLVLLTSVAFAIGVIRLGRRRCLVQELPAIEGLARVDTVCLDKTGTLTEGGMSVTELRTLDGSDEKEIRAVLAALGDTDPRPNASLRAIIDAFPGERRRPAGLGTRVLPFSSARGYSAARLDAPDGDTAGDTAGEAPAPRTWLLGAPDVLLPAAHPQLTAAIRLGEQGMRVLLLARAARDRDVDDPDVTAGARPTALVVMEQRLRQDAPDTLRYFAAERVDTKVLSGDNAVSVGAVAAKLGLAGAERALDARTLPAEPGAMAEAVEAHTVFGRVAPRQKQQMVRALQSRGHIVAMTGDGVNDVLALKDADVGVCMGSGSEATKAVAQVVLLDNTFAALPAVVAEGRRVIGNITRVATLFLLKTVYSVLLAILVVLFQVEYPFLPRHLTLLSTLTIGVPAFFLALAPNTERARPDFVRRVMRYAIPGGILMGAATFATYILARHYYTGPGALDAETSAATLTLFLASLWVLAIVARPYTWWRILLVLAMGLCFLLVLTVPWLQRFFALKLVGAVVPWAAVLIAAVASAGLEVVWRRAGRYGGV